MDFWMKKKESIAFDGIKAAQKSNALTDIHAFVKDRF